MGTGRQFVSHSADRAGAGERLLNSAIAASLQWDANGVAPGTGGSGAWNTASLVWFNGTTFQTWNNAACDDAVYGGTAGTVRSAVSLRFTI